MLNPFAFAAVHFETGEVVAFGATDHEAHCNAFDNGANFDVVVYPTEPITPRAVAVVWRMGGKVAGVTNYLLNPDSPVSFIVAYRRALALGQEGLACGYGVETRGYVREGDNL